jgi:hypothetical protein
MTQIALNARLELLRRYAWVRDYIRELNAKLGAGEVRYDEDSPLHADPWQNADEDIQLAADEAVKVGQLECLGSRKLIARHPKTGVGLYAEGPGKLYRITDAGYDWIRAHDALGEVAQEAPEQGASDA